MRKSEIIPSLASLRSKAEQARGARSAIERSLSDIQQAIRRLAAEEEILELTSTLLKRLMDMEVTEAKEVVETLLTEGLQNVFTDQDLRVRADVHELRGKVSMNLVTVEKHGDGNITEGISDQSNGGAVTTVQSILMRVITSMQRELRPFLALDESLPAFDGHYVVEMMRFLTSLCDRLGFDMVLVTQNKTLTSYANVSYELKKSRGKAHVKRT